MVCPRCIATVQRIFIDANIETKSIQLGEVCTTEDVSEEQKSLLEEQLLKNGFELLEDYNSKLINQIKSLIVIKIHHNTEPLKVNFSTFLSEELNHKYTWLSKLFSSVEGITIERFILKQKTERVKELLFYNELSLSEIAFQMDYSSTAHLSAQFKKETGMTPSDFKKIHTPNRQSLDSL